MTRGRRPLTEAEIEIWLAVARTVIARPGMVPPQPRAPEPPAAAPLPESASSPARPSMRERRIPVLPSYSPPVQLPRTQPPLAPLEKRYRQKVAHGRIEIDGALDLHGMTQPEAHHALRIYLRTAQAKGARLVLVVTGKGRTPAIPGPTSEREAGVLRRAVPTWLRADEMRGIVMGFEEASLPHGGHGALYVKIRRRGL